MAIVVTTAEKVSEYLDGKSPAITRVKIESINANPILSFRSMRYFILPIIQLT